MKIVLFINREYNIIYAITSQLYKKMQRKISERKYIKMFLGMPLNCRVWD